MYGKKENAFTNNWDKGPYQPDTHFKGKKYKIKKYKLTPSSVSNLQSEVPAWILATEWIVVNSESGHTDLKEGDTLSVVAITMLYHLGELGSVALTKEAYADLVLQADLGSVELEKLMVSESALWS